MITQPDFLGTLNVQSNNEARAAALLRLINTNPALRRARKASRMILEKSPRWHDREMDNCFENWDGKAVALALLRLADLFPNFADNLREWYSGPSRTSELRDIWPTTRARYETLQDHELPALARRLQQSYGKGES
jgi:hypothetical protein